MRRSIWVCAGLSAALHATLVAGWSPGVARVAAAPAAETASAGVVSLVLRPRSAAGAAGAAGAAERLAERPTAAPAPPTDPAGKPGLAAAGTAAAATAPAASAAAAAATHPQDDYVPRPQLSVVPRPSTDIMLAYPADGPAVGHFVATLTLYIDADGWVRRVDIAGDDALPATLRLAARDAFAKVQFSPGQVDGVIVKSRLRIEAVYDSRILPPTLVPP